MVKASHEIPPLSVQEREAFYNRNKTVKKAVNFYCAQFVANKRLTERKKEKERKMVAGFHIIQRREG